MEDEKGGKFPCAVAALGFVRWSGFVNPDRAGAGRVGIGRLNFYRLRYPLS